MQLGVFLAIGESFSDFKKKGQDKLIINNNLKNYSDNFSRVYVFSYGNESMKLFDNVFVLPNKYNLHRYLYSLLLPLFYFKKIRSCRVFRGLQITGAIPAVLTKVLFGKKVVVNYGYDYAKVSAIEGKYLLAAVYSLVEKILIGFCDRIIITSKELKKQFKNYKNKIVYLPNSVDTKLFSPLGSVKKYSIIFVGRLEKQKNLNLLISACAKMKTGQRKTLFIGSGRLKNELTRKAKKLKVNLKIIDKVSHEFLPNYYNQAKIFVLPSTIEGNPKVLLEAMSCGLPCIGNQVTGIKSIIEDNKNGLLFNNTESDLLTKITFLLGDSKNASRLGRRARKSIVSDFNYQKLKKKEISILKI